MKVISYKGKKLLVGMTWRWPEDKESHSKAEISAYSQEVGENLVKYGIIIKPQKEVVDVEEKLVVRSGFGLVIPDTAEDEDIAAKARSYYSLANIFCVNYPNAVIIQNLGDHSDSEWWFCATVSGSVVVGTDVYGSRSKVLAKAEEFAKSAMMLYGDIPPRFISTSESAFERVNSSFTSLSGNEEYGLIFEDRSLDDVLSNPWRVRRIGQIKGIDPFVLLPFIVIGILIFVGWYAYSSYQENERQKVIEAQKLAKIEASKRRLANKSKSTEKKEVKPAASVVTRQLQMQVRKKIYESLVKNLTQTRYEWAFQALDVVQQLPYSSSGYVFSSANCDHSFQCRVLFVSNSEASRDPRGFSKILSKWNPENNVVNGFDVRSLEKVISFEGGGKKGLIPSDLNRLPQTALFINSVLFNAADLQTESMLREWQMSEPELVQESADLGNLKITDKNFVVPTANYIKGSFSFSVNNIYSAEVALTRLFEGNRYMGLRSMSIEKSDKFGYVFKFGGVYASASK